MSRDQILNELCAIGLDYYVIKELSTERLALIYESLR